MKNLLIIDDHPIVLEGIQSVLNSRRYSVIKATSAPEAMMAIRLKPDIDMVVCDLSLNEGTDGLDLIQQMRSEGFAKPTIIYTMHEELWNVAAMLRANVEGMVFKAEDPSELVLAIDQVAKGKQYRSPTFSELRTEALLTDGILSAKDIEVLTMLANGKSNRQISECMCLSEKSIEYHRSNIIKKLCSKTMVEAIRRAIHLGIITALAAIIAFEAQASAPQPVDLGLSVLWADRNLGADDCFSTGGFYAFGETATKDCYSWDTYEHCDNADMFQARDLGTDNISGTQYDAAHVILGSGWRLPTPDECEELADCAISFDLHADTHIVVFTGDNGNSITIPVTGYMSNDRLVHPTNSAYWTGYCEYEEFEDEGISYSCLSPFYMLLTPETVILPTYGNSSLGCQIRPVLDRRTSTENISLSETEITGIYTPGGLRLSKIMPGVNIIRYSDGRVKKIIRRQTL